MNISVSIPVLDVNVCNAPVLDVRIIDNPVLVAFVFKETTISDVADSPGVSRRYFSVLIQNIRGHYTQRLYSDRKTKLHQTQSRIMHCILHTIEAGKRAGACAVAG
jgi:hypothetical protein